MPCSRSATAIARVGPSASRQADEHLVDRLPFDVGCLATQQLVHSMRRREAVVEWRRRERRRRDSGAPPARAACRRGRRTFAPHATPPRPCRDCPDVRRSRSADRRVRDDAAARPRRRTSRGRGGGTRLQWTGPLPSQVAPVDSEKTRMCSCRAAIRLGTTWSGNTILARTGALTRLSDLRRLDVFLRQRLDFAERQREVERRVRDGAEVRVGPR